MSTMHRASVSSMSHVGKHILQKHRLDAPGMSCRKTLGVGSVARDHKHHVRKTANWHAIASRGKHQQLLLFFERKLMHYAPKVSSQTHIAQLRYTSTPWMEHTHAKQSLT